MFVNDYKLLWILLTCIFTINVVQLQMPMPMYPMAVPQMVAMARPPPPVPVPVPVPVGIPIAVRMQIKKTTTTPKPTDSDENTVYAIPMPVPLFPAFSGMPPPSRGLKNNSKPPICPPCSCDPCMPRQFSLCSSCHKICSCIGMPGYPIPAPYLLPPPILMIPVSPVLARKTSRYSRWSSSESSASRRYRSSDSSTECDSSASSDSRTSSESYNRKRRKRRRWRKRKPSIYRKNFNSEDSDHSVEAVLSYVARNGDIKYRKKISKAEAAKLIGNKTFRSVQVMETDDSREPKVMVVSRGKSKKSKHKKRE